MLLGRSQPNISRVAASLPCPPPRPAPMFHCAVWAPSGPAHTCWPGGRQLPLPALEAGLSPTPTPRLLAGPLGQSPGQAAPVLARVREGGSGAQRGMRVGGSRTPGGLQNQPFRGESRAQGGASTFPGSSHFRPLGRLEALRWLSRAGLGHCQEQLRRVRAGQREGEQLPFFTGGGTGFQEGSPWPLSPRMASGVQVGQLAGKACRAHAHPDLPPAAPPGTLPTSWPPAAEDAVQPWARGSTRKTSGRVLGRSDRPSVCGAPGSGQAGPAPEPGVLAGGAAGAQTLGPGSPGRCGVLRPSPSVTPWLLHAAWAFSQPGCHRHHGAGSSLQGPQGRSESW